MFVLVFACFIAAAPSILKTITVEGHDYNLYSDYTARMKLRCPSSPETLYIPEKVNDNGHFYSIVSFDSLYITGCTNFYGDLIFPDTVVDISIAAFKYAPFDGILKLSKNMKIIPHDVFDQSKFTGDLIIPDSVTEIEARAFSKSKFNGKLQLSENLKKIGSEAFKNCKFSGNIVIPDSVEEIGVSAFENSGTYSNLQLSNNLTKISNKAFKMFLSPYFTGDLVIPGSVIEIGDEAFYGNNFDTITLHENIISISSSAFNGVNNVKQVIYHGRKEPSNCNNFNLKIRGINVIHVDPDYQGDHVCSISIYVPPTENAESKMSSTEIAEPQISSFHIDIDHVDNPITEDASSGIGEGAIIGISLAVIVLVAIIIVLSVLLFIKRNKNKDIYKDDSIESQCKSEMV